MRAQSRTLPRLALFALSAVPLVVKVPYLWRAWAHSPLDRTHLNLYGALALVAICAAIAVLLRWHTAGTQAKGRIPAIALLGVFLAAYAGGIILDVNALQLIAAVGILWSAAWLALGRVAALLFAPAALFATLAVPGTLHWMRNISAAFAVTPRAAFTPVFTPRSQPGMLGREVPLAPALARFFRTSDAHQFTYANISNAVSALAVSIGGDIHEVHPATHCLRSGGWRIVSEKIVQIEHPNGGILEVDEAVADSFKGRMVIWIWYSSDEASTGSFLNFRRMYSKSARWRTYQVATSVGEGEEDLAAARLLLRRFLAREVRP